MIHPSSYNVLIVEDDSNDVLFIQRAFRLVNPLIETQVVKDGDAAVDYLSGNDEYGARDRYPLPAIILLDLKLPRRSGGEVLQWLRQQDQLRRIPVVILTSSCERIDVDLSYDLGVNSYLVKPVSFDDLAEMIAALHAYWLGLNEYPTVALAD